MDDLTKRQIEEYRDAYFAANLQDSAAISYNRGWFSFADQRWKNYRRGDIVKMTKRLQAREK